MEQRINKIKTIAFSILLGAVIGAYGHKIAQIIILEKDIQYNLSLEKQGKSTMLNDEVTYYKIKTLRYLTESHN